jgi:hypothetical protein
MDAQRKYRSLCDMAAEYSIAVNVECFPSCVDMPSLDASVSFLREAARPNAGIVVDLITLASVTSHQAMPVRPVDGANWENAGFVGDASRSNAIRFVAMLAWA